MAAGRSPYAGQQAALATRHAKHRLVAPPLRLGVGLAVVDTWVDTDALGTFSGEVPRPADPLETARRKARLAMDATGLPLGLASEGSVADPTGLGVLVVDHELVVLVDDTRGVTVVGRATGTEVVAVATTVAPGDPVAGLLARANVPPHHLVVHPVGVPAALADSDAGDSGRPNPVWQAAATKAIADEPALRAAVARAQAVSPIGRARVETDLRAHLCPSRQPVITAAAHDLATRLATPCPQCAGPGWGVEGVEVGRACGWCGGPTDEVAADRWACPSCAATERRDRAPGVPGDPGRCGRCNP